MYTMETMAIGIRITMKPTMIVALFVLILMILSVASISDGALQVGFYNGKCNSTDVEKIVSKVVKRHFFKDPSITASLIRMQFHDCFVHVSTNLTCLNNYALHLKMLEYIKIPSVNHKYKLLVELVS